MSPFAFAHTQFRSIDFSFIHLKTAGGNDVCEGRVMSWGSSRPETVQTWHNRYLRSSVAPHSLWAMSAEETSFISSGKTESSL